MNVIRGITSKNSDSDSDKLPLQAVKWDLWGVLVRFVLANLWLGSSHKLQQLEGTEL